MRKRNVIICVSLALIGVIITTVVVLNAQSKENDKEIVVSEDIREDIKAEEEEVNVLKDKANEYLNQDNFAEAKNLYEKAILLDKGNKDLYLEIKDEYINKDRLDDAYYVIKTAIDNQIDVDNMNVLADDIKGRFNKIEYNYNVVQGDSFELPSEGTINVNGQEINVVIDWKNSVLNTSTPGIYSYEGVNDQYGRRFLANLNVKYKKLTESEVRDMSLKVKTLADNVVDLQWLDTKNDMEIEDKGFFTTSKKFKTRQEIYNYLYDYFTDDIINRYLNFVILERDGVLYIKEGQNGLLDNLSVENDEVQIEETETTLTATYTTYIDGVSIIKTEFRFIKYNNSWISTNIYFLKNI